MDKEKIVTGNIVNYLSRLDDIVEISDNEDWDQPNTLDAAKQDTLLFKKLVEGQRSKGVFIKVGDKHLSKELIHYYQTVEFGEVARALLINSFGSRIMGNLYLKLFGGKPNEAGRVVPIKLFTKKKEAIKWLLQEVKRAKQ
ncbi:MAG: Unknown protein [uncultured Aureispira sp.]|uniref:STAS/SEC14 domain-containing protein n=1 Tax=uncultured Aureispira sp. TaxID=1331704 RepID=A0A6S6SAQ4_9BACT|nr:MAG: Unknown protein [uncultured Aureispira sp.]